MNSILILGGYGNFGKRIATALVKDNISIIIAGRDENKANLLRKQLQTNATKTKIKTAIFDVNVDFKNHLSALKPKLVINTIGPFQTADYTIAKTCIEQSINYIDLADGREFVANIGILNQTALAANISVISGASTVPALSSAVVEKYKDQFSKIHSLDYGISPGQKAERGLATTKGILTYIGKQIPPPLVSNKIRYGWQDIHRVPYPQLGNRWMANCEIPDFDLLPKKYGIDQLNFSAGMENGLLHLGIWCLSWLVRLGLPLNLTKHAAPLLKISHIFDWLGTNDGGMHMIFKGKDLTGNPKTIKWFIIAKNGDGPQIPTIPAIILVKKIIGNDFKPKGALPCVNLVTLEEYMQELLAFDIKTHQL